MDFKSKIAQLKTQNLYRQVEVNNDKLINFCTNDYLGLKNNQKIIQTLQKSADIYGVGSGGSHLISGHLKPHQELEEILASITKQEKAIVFANGYMANMGVFSALKDDINWVLQDKLNHASLIDANFLIAKKIQRYKHNDINSLKLKLQKQQDFGLIATESVFSMDGDKSNIDAINHIIQEDKAIFMQDGAHSFGIYPPNIPKGSIYMATFGKAIGTYGAFVAGDTDLIDYIINKSRQYIYTTAMPPAIASATIAALKIIENNDLQEKLFNNIKYFKSLITTTSATAIQPIIIGDNNQALKISTDLKTQGFLVKAIRPPTVKTAILRITLSAAHSKEQIFNLANALNYALKIDN